jgi:hypothetical protein
MQRAFEFARRAVTGQTLAGIDATGNRYYAWPEKAADGSMVERRQVKVKGGGLVWMEVSVCLFCTAKGAQAHDRRQCK